MDSKVQVLESSFVAPSKPTPTKGLWVSSLDLEHVNRGHITLYYLYGSNGITATNFFDVARLKKAMAKALVVFYPLAGRLGVANGGRNEIRCNDEGVLFVAARADLTADDIKNMKPSPELRRLVVPHVDDASIMLATKVTFLNCGGVALGISINHISGDLPCLLHFIQTWSAFNKHGDCAAVELPCHDRTLLRARSPPAVHPDALLTLYTKIPFSDPLGPVASKEFTISRDQVASLKRLCGGTSTFCAVSALLWRWTCIARRLPLDSEASLTFSANVRRSVRPPLPDRYFGNAVIRLGVTRAVRDIATDTEALGCVANHIKGALDRLDDELVRSAIDYYEMAEMDNRLLRGTLPQTHLHIVSWLGMPIYDADFGCGTPRVMSRAESIRGGFIHLMNNNEGTADGGGVRVLVCMEAANMMEREHLLYAKL